MQFNGNKNMFIILTGDKTMCILCFVDSLKAKQNQPHKKKLYVAAINDILLADNYNISVWSWFVKDVYRLRREKETASCCNTGRGCGIGLLAK